MLGGPRKRHYPLSASHAREVTAFNRVRRATQEAVWCDVPANCGSKTRERPPTSNWDQDNQEEAAGGWLHRLASPACFTCRKTIPTLQEGEKLTTSVRWSDRSNEGGAVVAGPIARLLDLSDENPDLLNRAGRLEFYVGSCLRLLPSRCDTQANSLPLCRGPHWLSEALGAWGPHSTNEGSQSFVLKRELSGSFRAGAIHLTTEGTNTG